MRVIGGVSQSAQSPDYAQWLTKAVAARRLDVSTKTIEQWDKAGTLPGTLYRRPTGGPRLRVYNPARVADLVAARRLGRPVTVLGPDSDGAPAVAQETGPFLARAPLEPAPALEPRAASALGALVELLTAVKAASESSQSLVLTLAQAAAVSGWSVGFLRRAIRAGRLRADRDRWRGPEGRRHVGWKIRRKDLEAL